jgi:cell division protein FtsB
MAKFALALHRFLYRPGRVFLACFCLGLLSLFSNGTFMQLYKLERDRETLVSQIVKAQQDIAELDRQLKLAKDPAFIEKQALDRYDLIDENDLMFVFADDAS